MLSLELAELLNKKYLNWLKQNGACKFEIIKGSSSRILNEIKTGHVDMAGSDWPILDENEIYFGGYCEERVISPNHTINSSIEIRNIHIGIDIFRPVNELVFAPLDGIIHSFKNNNGPRDFGPCIVLQHDFEDLSFFTLYGHLSIKDIEKLETGQFIKAGQNFASLGDRNSNGGWPPHLHFQIILNMFDFKGEYYGLCNSKELEFWNKICPNPKDFLGIKSDKDFL